MERTDTQMMKGVAILFMLYLHLFNQMGNVELCTTFLQIDGMPFVHWLSRATSPVSFFLILGGYGLYFAYRKGDKHRFSRIIKLYYHYWIILTVFVLIGWFVLPNRYPGSWLQILGNYTSFNTSYNGECWFLFPYVLISLTSHWLFRWTDKFKAWHILICAFVMNFCTSYIISRYGSKYLYDNLLVYNPFLYFHLLFSFLIGAMAARENWAEYLPKIQSSRWIWLFLAILMAICCVINTSIFSAPYTFCFIALFLRAPKWNWVKKVLIELGNCSMDMWFIHSWFSYYIFHNFIYSFKYPVLIFAVLASISYICAKLVALFIQRLTTK